MRSRVSFLAKRFVLINYSTPPHTNSFSAPAQAEEEEKEEPEIEVGQQEAVKES